MEEFITTQDGTRLYWEAHLSSGAKASVIIVHGLNEHCGRYGHVIDSLREDYSVFLYDQRGHGRSEGHRSHVDRFNDLVSDLKQFVEHVRQDVGNQKIFLIGHSMGGQVVLNYLGQNPQGSVTGFITSSPNIRILVKVNPFKKIVGKKVAERLPKLHIFNEIAAHFLSHDPPMVEAYKKDPLVGNKISLRLANEILVNQETILDYAQNITIPALMMHGGDDKICDPKGSVEFFNRLVSQDKTLKLFEGMYHEIFNEVERQSVLKIVKRWLDNHAHCS